MPGFTRDAMPLRFDETGLMEVREGELDAEGEPEALLAALDPGEFTQLLIATRDGDAGSWSDLVRLVYSDLKRLARRQLTAVDTDTLGATGLVNECYLRLFGKARVTVANRRHFFYLASRVMRQILCDQAREQLSEKRGGSQRREELSIVDAETFAETERLVMIDDALRMLERENARLAHVFECRYFAGLSEADADAWTKAWAGSAWTISIVTGTSGQSARHSPTAASTMRRPALTHRAGSVRDSTLST